MDAAARALSEPKRREILRLVRDEERTVADIAEHFAVSRPAISQHLRVLSDADLVSVRSEGTRRFYRARPEGLADLADWMNDFWSSSLKALKIEVEQEQWNKAKAERGIKAEPVKADRQASAQTQADDRLETDT